MHEIMALRELIRCRPRMLLGGGITSPLQCFWFSGSADDDSPHRSDDSDAPVISQDDNGVDEAKRKAAEFLAMGFTERQAAYLSPDPEKARLPRLTRKEAGSYGRPDLVAQYVKELQQGLSLPQGASMYNLDSAMPEILDPVCPEFDAMMKIKEDHPEMSIVEIARMVGFEVVESEDSVGAEQGQLNWTYRNVLVPLAAEEEHPVNSKVSCEFDLESLQKHYDLSDAAARYIATICDSRYNAATGTVTLVSDRFPSRAENQERIERMIKDLVKEGMNVHPRKGKRKAVPSEET